MDQEDIFSYDCIFGSDVPYTEDRGNTFLPNDEHILNITGSALQDTVILIRTTVTTQFLRSMYVDIMFISCMKETLTLTSEYFQLSQMSNLPHNSDNFFSIKLIN